MLNKNKKIKEQENKVKSIVHNSFFFFFFFNQKIITRGAMAGHGNYLVATIH